MAQSAVLGFATTHVAGLVGLVGLAGLVGLVHPTAVQACWCRQLVAEHKLV